MSRGSKKYRAMMSFLDGIGIIVCIDRVSKKQFTLLVNGEIKKSYKRRDSCNKQIVKMYNNQTQNINDS